MAGDGADVQSQLIKIGLEDPFIRAIAGIVVVAAAASAVISLLGDGMKAILAIGLSIVFGVILVLMRVLIRNTDGLFIRWLSYIVSGTIAIVFVLLIVFVVPAVVICWPAAYSDTLGLKACSATVLPHPGGTAFTPIPFTGQGIAINPDNGRLTVLVFYRAPRQTDAEHVVGALLSAGFKSTGQESTLNEVQTDDRSPNVTLIKTAAAAQPEQPEILRIVKLSIPVLAEKVRTAPGPVPLIRGDAQVDLF